MSDEIKETVEEEATEQKAAEESTQEAAPVEETAEAAAPAEEKPSEETAAEAPEAQDPAAPEPDEKPLEKMTVKELREVAMKIPGVDGVHAMKKAEVLAIIKEYRGMEDEEPEAAKKNKVKVAVSKKELIEKADQLREEKEAVRGEKDRKKITVLRRRISRLKKLTRKTV